MSGLQHALMTLMSDISERCYCAGWSLGLENILWAMVVDPSAPREFGMDEVSDAEVEGMRELSRLIGGWIIYDRANGETFVTMEQWVAMYPRSWR